MGENMRCGIKMFVIIVTAMSMFFYQNQVRKLCMLISCHFQFDGLGAHSVLPNAHRQNKTYTIYSPNTYINITMYLQGNLPPLYIITPTYRRPEQLAELTRLAQTLMLVPNIYWLVIEDAVEKSLHVFQLLSKTGLRFEHLTAPMPNIYKKSKFPRPRGVSNRNKGLSWLRENAKEGVLYFADDDNTYNIELFYEMRFTKRVSMWPVGLVTELGVSSPIIRNGVFDGFYDGWLGGRKFAVDMAGFAIAVKFLLDRPLASMPYLGGYEEDGFIKSLEPFEPEDIELLASNCSRILVWHTQTKRNRPAIPLDHHKYVNTNLVELTKILV